MSRRRRGAACGSGMVLALALGVLSAATAQTPERYRGRLSILPIDVASAGTLAGSGEVTAELRGDALTVEATFSGLTSPATGIEVRQAPRAQRGEVALTLDLGDAGGTAGRVQDTLRLTPRQIATLRDGHYYVQVRTAGHPAGEIRGWLLARE